MIVVEYFQKYVYICCNFISVLNIIKSRGRFPLYHKKNVGLIKVTDCLNN